MPECRPPDPVYRLLINWDENDTDCAAGSTGFDVGTFENDTVCSSGGCVCDTWCADHTQCWYGAADSGATPVLARDVTRAHTGSASLRTAWQTGAVTPRAELRWTEQWMIGRTYRVQGWVYVPTGSPDVYFYVNHLAASGVSSTVKDIWEQISITFTAGTVGGSGDVQLRASGATTTGQHVYIDDVVINRTDEDVWSDLRWGTTTGVEVGRDQSRELSPFKVGRLSTTLDNSPPVTGCADGVVGTALGPYWPRNQLSPLYGEITPTRPVKFDVELDGETYTLYRGYSDEYSPQPDRLASTVQITANDVLGIIEKKRVSTGLHQGITTGQAVSVVLDTIGWPTRQRVIDPGLGVLPFFWAESDNALSVLLDLVNSEGPPALLYVDSIGRIVFKDRSHRLVSPRSIASQMTITDNEMSPRYSLPMSYDYGWRDIINDATYTVDIRAIGVAGTQIWTSDETTYVVLTTTDVSVSTSDPFLNAITPVAGTDYTVISGAVSIALVNAYGNSRTSGSTVTIRITATSAPASITNLRLRAQPVTVTHTVQRTLRDIASSDIHGVKTDTVSRPWLSSWDAVDVIANVITHHSRPLEQITLRLLGYDTTTLHRQLGTRLSDRLRVTDSITGLNDLFYVEQINHSVDNNDQDRHSTVFGLERIPDVSLGECFILDNSILDNDVLCGGFTGFGGLDAGSSEDSESIFVLAESTSPTIGAPPLREYRQTASWQTSAVTKSITLTTRTDDVLVIVASTADSATTLSAPTGNALTYTLQQSNVSGGNPAVYLYTAHDTYGGNNWTLSMSSGGTQTAHWGFGVYVFSRCDSSVGASAQAGPAVGAPSLPLVTTVDNSAVVVLVTDNTAADSRTSRWRTASGYVRPSLASNTEKLADRDTNGITVYSAYYHNVGSLGAETVGMETPANQDYIIMAVEIKGLFAYGPCRSVVTERPSECLSARAVLDFSVLGS